MECVANYEVKAECSVVEDDLKLRIRHPKNQYSAIVRNIARSDYTTPFLLSLQLCFEAPSLDDARDIAEEHLADCLNMLCLATGSSFKRYRIRQVVDASPGTTGMKTLLMWSDSIDHEDPQPFLSNETVASIERLSKFDVPPAIRRAMRWYRLGIGATAPDDQFTYFWFALEIIAVFQKDPNKVPDKCPHCESALYCESCKTHPTHKPYPKQAIHALLKSADKECDDATVKLLEKTRNSLMHGKTLREIEANLPEPRAEIVDILGRLLWKALILQFRHEMFDGTLILGAPSTYVHRTMHGIAHMQTVVPFDGDGDLDLSFKGTTIQFVVDGPPQSALPSVIRMSSVQYERLGKLASFAGDHQEMCKRIYGKVKRVDDGVQALVLATDMATIRNALDKEPKEEWQKLFSEIIGEAGGESAP